MANKFYTIFVFSVLLLSLFLGIAWNAYAELTDDIVGYWRLDESSGNATDATGNGFTLTNVNSMGYDGGGLINNSAEIESSGKYLSGNYDLGITNGSITISFWVKMISDVSGGLPQVGLISKGDDSSNVFYLVGYEYNSGTPRLAFDRLKADVAHAFRYYTITLGTSVWHHIVLTYDGENLGGYVDNTAISDLSTSGDGSGTGSDITSIGYDSIVFPFSPDALIDEVGVWERKLTADEVAELYNDGDGLSYNFSEGEPPAPEGATTTIPLLTDEASTTFASIMGFEWGDIVVFGSDVIKIIAGNGVAILYTAIPWAIAILAISALVGMIFMAFGFVVQRK